MAGQRLPLDELTDLGGLITSPLLSFERAPDIEPAIAPHRVAELARGVYGSAGTSRADKDQSVEEAVVCEALGPYAALPDPDIDLTQLLVTPRWGDCRTAARWAG